MYWIVIILWSVQCSMSHHHQRVTRSSNDKELVITGLKESRVTKQEQTLHYIYNDGEQINMHCGRRDKQSTLLLYRDCGANRKTRFCFKTKDLSYKNTFFSKNNNTCITCIQWTEWGGSFDKLNSINIVFHLTQDGVFINGLPENNIHEINKTHDEYTFNDKEKRTVSCTLELKSNAILYDLSFKLLDANDNDIFSYDNDDDDKDERNKQMTITFYDYFDKHKLRCIAIEPKSSQGARITHEKTIILHRKEIGTKETDTNDTIVSKDFKPYYGVSIAVLLAVVILFIIVIVCLVRSRHRKRSNRLGETDMNYENLSKKPEVSPNKPVVLPNKPKLSLNKPVKEEPTYSESADKEPFYATVITAAADSSTYSRPYIEKDLTELYAKPIPKSEREKLENTVIYAQVLPTNRNNEYQNLKDNNESDKYVDLASSSNLNESKESSKYVNVGSSSQNYTNVFDNSLYVNSSSNDEYAEPAYCGIK